MSVFFLCIALLVVIVLALLLPSLQRRRTASESIDRREFNIAIAREQLVELEKRLADGELPDPEFRQERSRLERDLAVDIEGIQASEQPAAKSGGHWMTWPVAVLIPVMAGYVYLTIGTPEAIDPANRQAKAPVQQTAQPAAREAPDIQDVIARIEERLQQQPDDAVGWFMLGRAHMTAGDFPEAVEAIRKSYSLNDQEPEVMIRLADAIAMSQGGSMAGEPEPLLQRALAMQPNNPQGLWLLGMAQSERRDSKAAISTWESLVPLLQDDQQSQLEVARLLKVERGVLAAADQATGAAVDESPATKAPAEQPLALTVNVTLPDGIAADLAADTTVFVYAKAANGPPMPLAVARRTLADIPFSVTLSDQDAMLPAMKLSGFERVVVGARLSRSGNAIAEPGDIFGEMADISTAESAEVDVQIKDIVPQ